MSLCTLVNEAFASGELEAGGVISQMLGPLYLGIPASALLYGITCCQAFYYYRSEKSKRDHWILRSLVTCLMILTFAQEAFVITLGYHYMVTNYANPCQFLGKIYWSFPSEMIINALLEISVEGFLIRRTYLLSRNIYMAAVCGVLVSTGFALTLAVPGKLWSSKDNVALNLIKQGTLTSVSKGIVALGDASNTATMVFYLHRCRTGFRRSENLVTKLVILTISTGALTAIISLGDFLGVVLSTHTSPIVFFDFLVGKLYVNVLLTTLGMRDFLLSASTESSAVGVNSVHLSRLPAFIPYARGAPKQHIKMDVENVVDIDHSEEKGTALPGSLTASSSSTLPNNDGKASQ